MLERSIPSTGERLPVIGCGTWQVFDVGNQPESLAPVAEVIQALADGGGTLIDTSPMYGRSEENIGRALPTDFRTRAFLATKIWTSGREAGVAQMERSMKRLGTDSLDLIQVHNLLDWETHLNVLLDWKAQGRVRYLGVTHYSNTAHHDLAEVMKRAPIDFVQFNYAINDRHAERLLLPLARERGLAVLINRPFGEGQLFRHLQREPLPEIAKVLDCSTWAELALKYILADDAVTCVIPATRQASHMKANLKVGFGPLPDPDQRRQILTAAGL